ncbi:serine/threonine protein kinase, putative [Plasmodium ovale wallikeri]|uniref:Serine/threonine protein kinase, putative n=2 Tax=Plasmodium ovale TaxID=36330 RepID=A0A1A8YRM8_PLAOA|nr:serine/threonine protein kinase, putative [Plasmodium ovale wallikeri]SBT34157.1 serine/threonine protein kinase, putative [Plasmodium ovale wallikeri]SBT76479.1 serine/threonine protein kinase, putative [Plasmodium ovale]
MSVYVQKKFLRKYREDTNCMSDSLVGNCTERQERRERYSTRHMGWLSDPEVEYSWRRKLDRWVFMFSNEEILASGTVRINPVGNYYEDAHVSRSRRRVPARKRAKCDLRKKQSAGEVFTIVSYDYIRLIREGKMVKRVMRMREGKRKESGMSNSDEFSEGASNSEYADCAEHEEYAEEAEEAEKEELLRSIEREEIPKKISTEMNIEGEYTLQSKHYKRVDIIFVKKYSTKKKKYIMKKIIKKVYKHPKESIFNPFLNSYICFENLVKLEKRLTQHLVHENVVKIESCFYDNENVVALYKYGGVPLMKWNKRKRVFQFEGGKCTVGRKGMSHWASPYSGIHDWEKRSKEKGVDGRVECGEMWRQGRYVSDGTTVRVPSWILFRRRKEMERKTRKRVGSIRVYPEYLIAEILRQLLKVCLYLHQQKIYHSDIKPSNIVVRNIKKKNLNTIFFCKKMNRWCIRSHGKTVKKNVIIKIIDFEYSQKYYNNKANIGGTTSLFKPLEDFKNVRINVCTKIVWVIGITLFMLSTGIHPFSTINNDMHIFFLIKNKHFRIRRLLRKYSYFSDSFKDLLQRMLHVNCNKRISLFELFLHPFALFG